MVQVSDREKHPIRHDGGARASSLFLFPYAHIVLMSGAFLVILHHEQENRCFIRAYTLGQFLDRKRETQSYYRTEHSLHFSTDNVGADVFHRRIYGGFTGCGSQCEHWPRRACRMALRLVRRSRRIGLLCSGGPLYRCQRFPTCPAGDEAWLRSLPALFVCHHGHIWRYCSLAAGMVGGAVQTFNTTPPSIFSSLPAARPSSIWSRSPVHCSNRAAT